MFLSYFSLIKYKVFIITLLLFAIIHFESNFIFRNIQVRPLFIHFTIIKLGSIINSCTIIRISSLTLIYLIKRIYISYIFIHKELYSYININYIRCYYINLNVEILEYADRLRLSRNGRW